MEFSLPTDIVDMLLRTAFIMLGALGIVYLFGRLLPNKLKDRGKNIIAVIALFGMSLGLTVAYDPLILDLLFFMSLSEIYPFLWDTFLYFTFSCVFYVVVGWRLFSRVDSFLDRKVGKDDKRKHR